MCNKKEETLEHLMLRCLCFRVAREKVPTDVVEMIEKAGGNKTLQTAAHLVLNVSGWAIPCSRTTFNNWYSQQYEIFWHDGDANSTSNEKNEGLGG